MAVDTTRRTFVQGTAAAGTALALGTPISAYAARTRPGRPRPATAT